MRHLLKTLKPVSPNFMCLVEFFLFVCFVFKVYYLTVDSFHLLHLQHSNLFPLSWLVPEMLLFRRRKCYL